MRIVSIPAWADVNLWFVSSQNAEYQWLEKLDGRSPQSDEWASCNNSLSWDHKDVFGLQAQTC
jgi:hypothetical protein